MQINRGTDQVLWELCNEGSGSSRKRGQVTWLSEGLSKLKKWTLGLQRENWDWVQRNRAWRYTVNLGDHKSLFLCGNAVGMWFPNCVLRHPRVPQCTHRGFLGYSQYSWRTKQHLLVTVNYLQFTFVLFLNFHSVVRTWVIIKLFGLCLKKWDC